jgi:apolipoprotein D and lipocalin family protein
MIRLMTIGLILMAGAAQRPGPPGVVPAVNLDRYAGDWFEIARLPNRFQAQCAGDVRATYVRRADGRIDVINRCRDLDGTISEARGVARVVDSATNARLKVRFAPAALSWLPFVWGDYWIIGLASDYSWAVVGSPDRKYLWILARTPDLDGSSRAAALSIARGSGFDTDRLLFAKPRRDQLTGRESGGQRAEDREWRATVRTTSAESPR